MFERSSFHKFAGFGIDESDNHAIGITDFANTTADGELYSQTGRVLSAKKVRRWLWERRKERKLNRQTAMLWTVYDTVNDRSVVGIGAVTSKEAADKLADIQEQVSG